MRRKAAAIADGILTLLGLWGIHNLLGQVLFGISMFIWVVLAATDQEINGWLRENEGSLLPISELFVAVVGALFLIWAVLWIPVPQLPPPPMAPITPDVTKTLKVAVTERPTLNCKAVNQLLLSNLSDVNLAEKDVKAYDDLFKKWKTFWDRDDFLIIQEASAEPSKRPEWIKERKTLRIKTTRESNDAVCDGISLKDASKGKTGLAQQVERLETVIHNFADLFDYVGK